MALSRLLQPIRRFAAAVSGVAAIEFALILPVMVTMLLGMSEVTLGVNVDRKVTLLSRSLADLSSRASSLTTAQLSDVFNASMIVMQPFDSTKAQMVVSSMKVKLVGSVYQGTVDWSCAKGPNAVPKSSTGIYTVPTAFQTDGSYYMLVETTLPYTPIFGRVFAGTVNLGEVTPWPIRNSASVTLTGGCP